MLNYTLCLKIRFLIPIFDLKKFTLTDFFVRLKLMKRFITILTIFIFFGYILIAIYPFTPAFFKKSYTGIIAKKAKVALGFGPLFISKRASISKSISYKFYQQGKWQHSQLLLEPLFEDYKTSGSFSALKHCRLDSYLMAEAYLINKYNGTEKMLKSNVYSEFASHLFYRHNQNITPDSLEVSYYIKDNKTNRLTLLLTFKDKP